MTVRELIDALRIFPGHLPVLSGGFEIECVVVEEGDGERDPLRAAG